MDLAFYVASEVLTDGSVVYNVKAKEDEDDEEEIALEIWRAPSQVAAESLAAVLNEVGLAFAQAKSDTEYRSLNVLYLLAVK